MGSAPKFVEILQVLARHEVDFILVGGMAAIIAGAPISTFDLHLRSDSSRRQSDHGE